MASHVSSTDQELALWTEAKVLMMVSASLPIRPSQRQRLRASIHGRIAEELVRLVSDLPGDREEARFVDVLSQRIAAIDGWQISSVVSMSDLVTKFSTHFADVDWISFSSLTPARTFSTQTEVQFQVESETNPSPAFQLEMFRTIIQGVQGLLPLPLQFLLGSWIVSKLLRFRFASLIPVTFRNFPLSTKDHELVNEPMDCLHGILEGIQWTWEQVRSYIERIAFEDYARAVIHTSPTLSPSRFNDIWRLLLAIQRADDHQLTLVESKRKLEELYRHRPRGSLGRDVRLLCHFGLVIMDRGSIRPNQSVMRQFESEKSL